MGEYNFKQISTTTVWKYKKDWNINHQKDADDIKKLHHGLLVSNELIAFISIAIKNNEVFFHIYEKDSSKSSRYYSNMIEFVLKKALLLKKTRVSCLFDDKNNYYFEQLGFESFYSRKYATQIFSLLIKNVKLIELLN